MRDVAGLLEIGQIPDDGGSATVQEIAHCCESIPVTGVEDDVVPVAEQRLRRQTPQTLCGAGYEDASHQMLARTRAPLRTARQSRAHPT